MPYINQVPLCSAGKQNLFAMSLFINGNEFQEPAAPPPTNGAGAEHTVEEGFSKFFASWMGEQDQFLQQLLAVARDEAAVQDEEKVLELVEKVVRHYEHYYDAKGRFARWNVYPMFSPSWTSSLENTYHWIGRWRPTMAIHLLHSKSGLEFQSNIANFICGHASIDDVGGLRSGQLVEVDLLQREVIQREREITEKLATEQEKLADASMVELVHEASAGEAGRGEDGQGKRVESLLARKRQGLEEVLEDADQLRMNTLRQVVALLRPTQAVQFLIAAAELRLPIHQWGKEIDQTSTFDGVK